ncbi:MAG: hypothetical protein JRF56_21495 [Deltaproteobacteria bacterium]|jgi:L-lactate utilization protein LutB|nr:hypothetical protein [Deltaproteobacteria bacterium]
MANRNFSVKQLMEMSACTNCQEVCPMGIHLKDLWLSLRQDLVGSSHYTLKKQT